ncbi:hypothetical protein [Actinomadura harenae]|uniref:hypothetical protein n=1 Tax=Actinomadura harenae TaxID=2483351 RepID=UPI0011C3895C|nr:hypothetical protein [Actinomadura harenae]
MSDLVMLVRTYEPDRPLRVCRVPYPPAARGTTAVLVIPRGGGLRAPRLALFTGRDDDNAAELCPPGALTALDAHVVARYDDAQDLPRREFADVLTGRVRRPSRSAFERLSAVLRRYPGCSVAVGPSGDQEVAVLRGGATVRSLSTPRRSRSGADLWPDVHGSFLYCWTTAGLPLGDLSHCVLIVGRLGTFGDRPHLEASGRVLITSVEDGVAVRRLAS